MDIVPITFNSNNFLRIVWNQLNMAKFNWLVIGEHWSMCNFYFIRMTINLYISMLFTMQNFVDYYTRYIIIIENVLQTILNNQRPENIFKDFGVNKYSILDRKDFGLFYYNFCQLKLDLVYDTNKGKKNIDPIIDYAKSILDSCLETHPNIYQESYEGEIYHKLLKIKNISLTDTNDVIRRFILDSEFCVSNLVFDFVYPNLVSEFSI